MGRGLSILIGALTVLGGCATDTITSVDVTGAEDGQLVPRTNKASHNYSEVRTFPGPGSVVEGAWAQLVRNSNGVAATIHTRDLLAGYTYTVWAVVFEFPGNCNANGCGLDDLRNPAVGATIFGPLAGGLAGGNGQATLAGHTGSRSTVNDVLLGDGSLDNPTTAEIHFIIRCHGPAIHGMISEQIGSFNGGCNVGEPNEGLCEDVQFGVFLP